MAFDYPKGIASNGGTLFVPSRKLWLTLDRTRVVADGDPLAHFLFCVPGRPIPMEEAKRYGLWPPKEERPTLGAEVKEAAPEATKELRPQGTKRAKTRAS